jgi:catechol 2,3-dioxygenase
MPSVLCPVLVGRSAEVAELYAAVAAVAEERRGSTSFLIGEAGVGKSRLAREALDHFGLKVGESDDDLREAQQRLAEAGVPVVGVSDHTVTHSLYILDPDGNEVELYIDVQPEVWHDDPAAVFSPIKPLRL